jgi:hypothetical protein
VAVASFQKRHINARYVSSRKEALEAVLALVPEGAKVVRGDSMTVDQVGVMPALLERNKNTVIDPFVRGEDGLLLPEIRENRHTMQREAFFADVFITGTNAVTMDGKLVNTDARGNRVAPIIFGPEKVILVVGANKIVRNLDEALERIRQVAAPINVKRHINKHHDTNFEELPCSKTGRCHDCSSQYRICCSTVIVESSIQGQDRINVVLIGEELGI